MKRFILKSCQQLLIIFSFSRSVTEVKIQFSHTDRLCSAINTILLCGKQEKFNLFNVTSGLVLAERLRKYAKKIKGVSKIPRLPLLFVHYFNTWLVCSVIQSKIKIVTIQ